MTRRVAFGLQTLLSLGLVFTSSLGVAEETSPSSIPVFHPPGMWTWDNWFIHDGQQWHAFYLQLPKAVGIERRWKDNDFYKHVGHATSSDLRDWRDQGPALCALSGTWNDRHIATGSVVHHSGKWWMAFTGRGTHGDGVGLAVSDDLTTWKAAQDKPLFPLTATSGGGVDGGVFESLWKGKVRRWVGISDPYILPEPVDGWFYMVLCSRVLDAPLAQAGCLTLLRSRDLLKWEQPVILAWPQCFERMETPQLWTRNGHWYLSFGGVLNAEFTKANQQNFPAAVRGKFSHRNYSYRMDKPLGPASEDNLHYIDAPRGHYIMKVLTAAPDRDVALFTHADKTNSSISPAYPVEYAADGSLKLKTSSP